MPQQIDRKQIQQFYNLELLAKQVVEGFITGLHKSPFHGFSVEFSEHRLYNTGESIKNIDWKLFGRTDKLFTKRYEEETNLRCQFVIDNSSSMYFPVKETISPTNPNKILFSIYSTAALMYLLRKQRDASGLSVFSDKVETHTPAKVSIGHHRLLYYELEKLITAFSENNAKTTSTASALHEIAEKIHKRSLVVIFSDMLDNLNSSSDVFSGLQHLKHNKHEVIMFHVTDKAKEIDFDYGNKPYRFFDMENNKELKIHPNEIRSKYVKAMDDFRKELKYRCGQYRIDYIEADINQGFNNILLSYLIKREKLL